MSDVLRTVDLSKRFRNAKVLDGLNLAVPEGSVFALVGQNGAGKTTTIKILMNLQRPSSGHAEVFGHDSRAMSPADLMRIGYVSENQEMPDWMTVGYFMDYLKPFYPSWDDRHAADLLRQFELPLDRNLGHLSHGMRMKAALASSLAYRPKLIILDEPFTGLDPLVRDELIEGLVAHAEGATILISSHDLAETESFASHVGFLEAGRLQFAEELTSLYERFREVEITLADVTRAPENLPATWLNAKRSGHAVRFVESRFDEPRTFAEIRQVFGETRHVAANPMPLRAIFITLAKASRKAA